MKSRKGSNTLAEKAGHKVAVEINDYVFCLATPAQAARLTELLHEMQAAQRVYANAPDGSEILLEPRRMNVATSSSFCLVSPEEADTLEEKAKQEREARRNPQSND
jgi:hypothetical protein